MKIIDLEDNDGKPFRKGFVCPACGCLHWFSEPPWTWNHDRDKPTIRASIAVYANDNAGQRRVVCHSMVTDGRIEYLGDCAHSMRGQTVDIPDFETWAEVPAGYPITQDLIINKDMDAHEKQWSKQ